MKQVRVKKADLLAKLHENREIHVKDFSDVVEGYKEKVIENLEARLASIKAAGDPTKVKVWINLVAPEDHSEEYDRAIEMLGWELGDEVELDELEFAQLVQDDWGWKSAFQARSIEYTGVASTNGPRYPDRLKKKS